MDRIKNMQEPFFRKIVRPIPNKNEINNTPIRQRDQNKENSKAYNQHNFKQMNHKRHETQQDSINSYINQSSVANSKTVPKRRPSMPTRACVNHLDLEAQFKIQIDGENLNYCSKCAAHLASNGFQVEKIPTNKSPRRMSMIRSPALNKRRQQLCNFLESLKELEAGYNQRSEQTVKVIQSHEIEKETITNFYSSMFEYLEYIKDEHLNFLEEEASRNAQIGQIQAQQMGETMQELKMMREDIESNVDKIIQEVDQNSYKECMTYYNQKKEVHQHRLSELGTDIRAANCTTADCVQEKLSEFKGFIDELTGILSSKADSMY